MTKDYELYYLKLQNDLLQEKAKQEEKFANEFAKLQKTYVDEKLRHHIKEMQSENQKEEKLKEMEKAIEDELKSKFNDQIKEQQAALYQLTLDLEDKQKDAKKQQWVTKR